MNFKKMLGIMIVSTTMLNTMPLVYAKGDASSGKKIFATNCASCHGVKGAGDGVAAAALNPKPANFAKGKFKYGSTDAALKKIIKSGKGSMPPWGSVLSDKDVDNLIAHIRTLKK